MASAANDGARRGSLFSTIDANRDGTIDRGEFVDAMQRGLITDNRNLPYDIWSRARARNELAARICHEFGLSPSRSTCQRLNWSGDAGPVRQDFDVSQQAQPTLSQPRNAPTKTSPRTEHDLVQPPIPKEPRQAAVQQPQAGLDVESAAQQPVNVSRQSS